MGSLTLPDSLVELLHGDHRATFVLDLRILATSTILPVAHANPALETDLDLNNAIRNTPRTQPHDAFWDWLVDSSPTATADCGSRIFAFHGFCWTRSVFRQHWAVVGCNEQLDSASRQPKQRIDRSSSLLSAGAPLVVKDATGGTEVGWVVTDLMSEELPFVHVISSFDWAATPLGPISQWSAPLQQTFNQVLADSRPMVIYWGSKLSTLYNEAFSQLCGSKHPGLLGKSLEDAWPDFSDKIKRTMQDTASKHRTSREDEWRFFVEKADGTSEETYLKWSITPIMVNHDCLGFMQPVQDTTSMRLWDRRMKMLIDLGNALVSVRDVKSYWRKTIEQLELCDPSYDIPLAILYSVERTPNTADKDRVSTKDTNICRLEGSLGVPKGHPIIVDTLSIDTSSEGLSAAFRQALQAQEPTLLQTRDNTLPEALLQGLEFRGFRDPCKEAVVCPIKPTKEEQVMGLLVLGLNPRRPYDDDYQKYISLLNQKLTTTLASTVLLEEEARRNRNIAEQAAYEEAKLKGKLAVQKKEVTEWLSKFQTIAEFVPVGMCFGDSEGNVTFANDAWHRITGVPRADVITPELFLSRVIEEDQHNVLRALAEMRDTGATTMEFRVHRGDDSPLEHPIGSSPSFERAGLDLTGEYPKERHILASIKAESAPDGTILRSLACLTDVTLHKEAAEEAIRRAQQAENLQKMAEFATVGMYDMGLDGRLIGANNTFWEVCGLKKVDLSKNVVKPFESCVVDEDVPILQETIAKLIAQGKSQTAEIRFNTPWIEHDSAGNSIVAPRCVLSTFMPVKNSEGIIQTFTGCLSDVSLQRWQFETMRQRKDEAVESKRQQENFIDMTSHEMRNPLSAIVQCADAIIASLAKAQELVRSSTKLDVVKTSAKAADADPINDGLKMVESSIENAETIIACAAHQRRIVDDILTMSKMDSNLLSVTPTTVDPVAIATQAFRMFEVEARRVDISLTMDVDQSYKDLNIEFLDLDPSRLKQILINLLTNALKFTKSQATRKVSIRLGASKTRPTDATSSVQFIPRAADLAGPPDPDSSPDTQSDCTYLIFEVKDTGQGLTEEEKSSLFQRFVQANAKTHVQYGGSGLGLFISKRLTEMQNGAIGVASRPGHGSTFAFYIEAQAPSEAAILEARAAAEGDKLASQTATDKAKYSLSEAASGPGPFANAQQEIHIEGVLVVEDNLINQQITRRGLVDRGYKVDVANHGLEALERLQLTDRADGQFPLSLITMDMEMPKMDGLTCTRMIREKERTGELKGPRIPILAVSANAREEQIREAKAAGCDDVLVKPYRMLELVEKMRAVMQISGQSEKGSISWSGI